MMNSALMGNLKLWDGVHIEYLTELYRANFERLEFFESLVTLFIHEQDLQKATTWLLKHHYDNGQSLPMLLTERLLTTCKSVESWEAKLHLLQLLPHFKLTDMSIPVADDFVRNCLTDNNKFVRAWAYNGLFELTKYIPEMKTELEFLCQRAMETESAAIKSKVKKILLALNKQRKNTDRR